MADWPTLEMVKTQLGVTSSERDDIISQGLAAAIEQVCHDIGYVNVTVTILDPPTVVGDAVAVVPNYSISQAALILAVMAVKAPDAPHGIAAVFDTGGLRVAAQHPTYQRMLVGNRLSFGIG